MKALLAGAALALVATASWADYVPSKTKLFTIDPKGDLGPFMCESGRLLSATVANQRGFLVPLALLDDKRNEVERDKWVAVSGFRLRRRPDQVLNVVMVCGS